MTKPKVRRVTRVGKRSHCVVIPSTMIEELGWKDRQEVVVSLSRRGKKIIITDMERGQHKLVK